MWELRTDAGGNCVVLAAFVLLFIILNVNYLHKFHLLDASLTSGCNYHTYPIKQDSRFLLS